MSLGIAFKGAEGIVLAADSRVILTAQSIDPSQNEVIHVHYDNATKLLQINGQKYVGAVTFGAGAIGQHSPRTAHSYLPEFEASLGRKRLSVRDFASELSSFFKSQWESAEMPLQSTPLEFLVGGYDAGDPYGKVFQFAIPTSPFPEELHSGTGEFGMVWGGQKEFTDRLIAGFDAHLLEVVQEVLDLDDAKRDELEIQLKSRLQANIPFAFLPLQDSVDLSILLIRTTIAVQNWTVGIRGVGGPIDVATITRTEGFNAIQQKSISGERLEG